MSEEITRTTAAEAAEGASAEVRNDIAEKAVENVSAVTEALGDSATEAKETAEDVKKAVAEEAADVEETVSTVADAAKKNVADEVDDEDDEDDWEEPLASEKISKVRAQSARKVDLPDSYGDDYEDYDDSIRISDHPHTSASEDEDEDEEEDSIPSEEEFEDALPEVYAKIRKNSILKGVLPETPVIVFDHVTKEYDDGPDDDDNRALKDVSFKINKGEFVFIVGPSGSGKSTLIRLLMREIRPTDGSIYIAGTDLSKLRTNQVCKYRRSIGIVFQDFRLLEDRTVYENIAFAQKVIGAPSRKIARNVSKMLSLVGLRSKYKSYPNKLSGGEQQRVALARALINNPLILLADEPTGNLDPKNTEEIMDLLEEINMRGTTVVVVTHNHEIVDAMQKRVIMLNEGVVVDDKKGGYNLG